MPINSIESNRIICQTLEDAMQSRNFVLFSQVSNQIKDIDWDINLPSKLYKEALFFALEQDDLLSLAALLKQHPRLTKDQKWIGDDLIPIALQRKQSAAFSLLLELRLSVPGISKLFVRAAETFFSNGPNNSLMVSTQSTKRLLMKPEMLDTVCRLIRGNEDFAPLMEKLSTSSQSQYDLDDRTEPLTLSSQYSISKPQPPISPDGVAEAPSTPRCESAQVAGLIQFSAACAEEPLKPQFHYAGFN